MHLRLECGRFLRPRKKGQRQNQHGSRAKAQSGRKPRLRTAALTGGENDYQDFGWPRGCEDLSYSPHSDHFWRLTEYRYKGDANSKKYNRFVFSTKLGDYS